MDAIADHKRRRQSVLSLVPWIDESRRFSGKDRDPVSWPERQRRRVRAASPRRWEDFAGSCGLPAIDHGPGRDRAELFLGGVRTLSAARVSLRNWYFVVEQQKRGPR